MYGRQDDNSKLFAGVMVDPIDGRVGQILQQNLEDQLNPRGAVPADAAYRLHVVFNSTEAPIGTERDGTVTRYNVYLRSQYILTRISDGKQVTAGNIDNVSSYNNRVNEYYSTYVAQKDSVERGVVELARLYRQRLGGYLASGAPVQEIKLPDKNMQLPTGFESQQNINNIYNNTYNSNRPGTNP